MADGDGYDRYGQQHPKCKGRGKPAHDDDSKNHGYERLAGIHNAGAEDHADIVEVVSGAGHELARPIADVEFGLHEDKAIKETAANIELDVARNADEHPAGGERHQALEQDADDQDQAVDAERVAAVWSVERN